MRKKLFYTATSYLSEFIFTPIAFLINAKNIPKFSFRGFRGVNVSKSRDVTVNHCGCSSTGFTIFMDHFIIFYSNPEALIDFIKSVIAICQEIASFFISTNFLRTKRLKLVIKVNQIKIRAHFEDGKFKQRMLQ